MVDAFLTIMAMTITLGSRIFYYFLNITFCQVRPEACHYQGSIRDSPGSVVVMSTCDGLRGHFSNGEEVYHIQPHPDPVAHGKEIVGAHVVYKGSDIKTKEHHRCGKSKYIPGNTILPLSLPLEILSLINFAKKCIHMKAQSLSSFSQTFSVSKITKGGQRGSVKLCWNEMHK